MCNKNKLHGKLLHQARPPHSSSQSRVKFNNLELLSHTQNRKLSHRYLPMKFLRNLALILVEYLTTTGVRNSSSYSGSNRIKSRLSNSMNLQVNSNNKRQKVIQWEYLISSINKRSLIWCQQKSMSSNHRKCQAVAEKKRKMMMSLCSKMCLLKMKLMNTKIRTTMPSRKITSSTKK